MAGKKLTNSKDKHKALQQYWTDEIEEKTNTIEEDGN